MKKLLIAVLALALCLSLWACGQQTGGTNGGPGSTPTTSAKPTDPTDPTNPSQPDTDGMAMPTRRPAHNMGMFDEVEGWYLFEYAEGSLYPTRVTVVDREENVEGTFTLEFDDTGLPVKMLFQETGYEETTEVKLTCDAKGFITEAVVYDDEGQVTMTYLMAYNEAGRMVTTTLRMDDADMVMHYDELYRITLVEVVGEDVDEMTMEIAYDEDYFVIKNLVRDSEGSIITGFENFYGENGGLSETVHYQNGEIWYRGTYNEQGQLITEWIVEEDWDGERYEQLLTHEYDDQDRVIKTTVQENGEYAGYAAMIYSDKGCTYKVYGADNALVEMYYTEMDANGNQIKRVLYDEKEKVVETMEWEYDDEDRCLKEFTYGADGKLQWGYTYTYDANGNLVKQEEYDHTGVIASCDRVFDENNELVQETERYADGNYTIRDYLPDAWSAYREMNYDAQGNRIYGWENIMDEDGKVIKNIYYGEDGTRSETTYNEDGNPLIYIWYDVDGTELERRETTYHENGEAQQETYYKNGVMTEQTTYDDHGNMLTYKAYDENGGLMYQEKYTYTYYDDGSMKTKTMYNQNVKPVIMYQYDQLGEVERELYYTSTGDTSVRIDFETTYGNGTRQVKRSYYNNKGTLICTVTYKEVMDWFDWKLQEIEVVHGGMFMVFQTDYSLNGKEAHLNTTYELDEDGFVINYCLSVNETIGWDSYTVYQLFADGTSQINVFDSEGKLIRQVKYDATGHAYSDETFE